MTTPAEMCAHLIRFDTSNYGGGESTGETPLAEEIARLVREAGYDPQLVAREPHRASVIVRVAGSQPDLPGLLVHGHLDVVPAEPDQWTVPPFSGLIQDGYVYGRGAVDMKDMVANMVCTLLDWARDGVTPQRDIVFVFVADEEDQGQWGAEWLVDEHPELLQGVGAAIGESGGSALALERADGESVTCYPVAVAERGTLHLRLTARGTSGHGSRPTADSAITKLLGAAYRINNHRWPLILSDTVRRYITEVNAALGNAVDLDSDVGVERAIEQMGEAGRVAAITVRCSATTTVLKAGYKTNVIPGVAEAEVDVRCLPGTFDDTLATMIELVGPEVESELIDPGHPTNFSADSPWFASIREAILRHEPAAVVVPYCMGGGTDAKAFARLGAECFGFAPRTLDPDGRVGGGMHGVDERVPVSSVDGGQAILRDFLRTV